MNKGIDLVELAQKLKDQQNLKKDFIVETDTIEVTEDARRVSIPTEDGREYFEFDDNAHRQVATYLRKRTKMGTDYYRRMQAEAPDLFKATLEQWFRLNPEKRFFRTMDYNFRAFLSNGYKVVDHEDLMEVVFPILERSDVEIESCDVTDRRLYLKCFFPESIIPIKTAERGDEIMAGFTVENSEVGRGRYSVTPMVKVLSCKNGMTQNKAAFAGNHFGIRNDEIGLYKMSQETKNRELMAIQSRVVDVIETLAMKETFDALVRNINDAALTPVSADMPKVAEVIQQQYQLRQDERVSILDRIIDGGDRSKWGVIQAVTNVANTAEDYDLSSKLERVGGDLLDRPASFLEQEPKKRWKLNEDVELFYN